MALDLLGGFLIQARHPCRGRDYLVRWPTEYPPGIPAGMHILLAIPIGSDEPVNYQEMTHEVAESVARVALGEDPLRVRMMIARVLNIPPDDVDVEAVS